MPDFELRLYVPVSAAKALSGLKRSVSFEADDSDHAAAKASEIPLADFEPGDKALIFDDAGSQIWVLRD